MNIKYVVIRILLTLVAISFSAFSFGAGGLGPDLSLTCPCTIQSNSASSMTASYGVENIGSSSSNNLTLQIVAHTARTLAEAGNDRSFLGQVSLTDSLAANSQIAFATAKIPMIALSQGSYYITLLLVEDGFLVDQARMSNKVTLGGTLAGQAINDLYFDSDPSISISGTQATLTVPAIGNAAATSQAIVVQLRASDNQDIFASGSFLLEEFDVFTPIAARGKSVSSVETFSLRSLPEGNDFYHLVVSDGTFTMLVHLVQAPGVTFDTVSFSETSTDFLADTDGDDVGDENEKIMSSDPNSAASVPGPSTVDLLVVYSVGVTTLYDGDPTARFDHLVSLSNQALSDSNVSMSLRLVSAQELNIDKSKTIDQWLDDAEAAIGVYSDLEQRRVAAGADLVVMFRQYDAGDTCGLAGIGGDGTEGLMSRTTFISASFIDFDACGDLTMVHELGHNIGLGHSFRQNDTGTFIWARGHGIDDSFTTLMAYGASFDDAPELPFFSNPNVTLCNGSPCGIAVGQPESAFSAKSINVVRFQIAAFTPATDDADNDGVPDSSDAFPNDGTESVDTDSDGTGNNADTDDDNDGMPDTYEDAQGLDPLVDDAAGDIDMDGKTNLEEFQESLSGTTATQYLQTTSTSANITSIHIVNSSGVAQSFTGTLYNRAGVRLGIAGTALSSVATAEKGRLTLSSDDIETLFAVAPWSGPAMLEVTGTDTFELMAKLISPSGLVSNTNCVRQDRVLNIEGFNSDNLTFVRFINTTDTAFGAIKGTLYDVNGAAIGTTDTILLSSLAPKEAIFITGEDLATLIGAEWDDEAMLEVDIVAGLKLLNLNLVNGETFFNFSCFESSESGRMYIQTTSSSNNVSFTHLVNTSNSAQAFTGTLYNRDGDQLGSASQPLHTGTVPPKGRVILSSGEIETAFSASPWTGPAIVEIQGAGTFEVMTKLTSPSGLISNTNCVRSNQVHNVEPPGSSDKTFVRFINTGATALSDIKGSLYDGVGNVIGTSSQTLVASLPAKSAIFLNRDDISDIVGDTWNGAALLEVESPPAELRLLNLNFINSETFFNFSCYEVSQ